MELFEIRNAGWELPSRRYARCQHQPRLMLELTDDRRFTLPGYLRRRMVNAFGRDVREWRGAAVSVYLDDSTLQIIPRRHAQPSRVAHHPGDPRRPRGKGDRNSQ